MRLGLIGLSLLLSTSTAFSQSSIDWTGFYLGVFGGAGAGSVDFPSSYDEADHDFSGALLGIDAGYNFDLGSSLLLGLEGTVAWSGMSGSALVDAAPPPFGNQYEGTDIQWVATLAPRLAYNLGDVLIYAKAGLAFTSFEAWFEDDTGRDAAGNTAIGGLLGLGLEYAVADNWSVDAQYDFVNYGTVERDNGLGLYDTDMSHHAISIGINYHPD